MGHQKQEKARNSLEHEAQNMQEMFVHMLADKMLAENALINGLEEQSRRSQEFARIMKEKEFAEDADAKERNANNLALTQKGYIPQKLKRKLNNERVSSAQSQLRQQERDMLQTSEGRRDQRCGARNSLEHEAQNMQDMFDHVLAEKMLAENALMNSLEEQSRRSQEFTRIIEEKDLAEKASAKEREANNLALIQKEHRLKKLERELNNVRVLAAQSQKAAADKQRHQEQVLWKVPELREAQQRTARDSVQREANEQQEMVNQASAEKALAEKTLVENLKRNNLAVQSGRHVALKQEASLVEKVLAKKMLVEQEIQSNRLKQKQTSSLNNGNYYYQTRHTKKTDKLIDTLCKTHKVQVAKFANSRNKRKEIRTHVFSNRRRKGSLIQHDEKPVRI